MSHVDLYFGVTGDAIPLDHGFALYAAICRTMDAEPAKSWFHTTSGAALIPIRGLAATDRRLHLDRSARFGLRLPATEIPHALVLAGKRMRIGDTWVRVGVSTAYPIVPAATLRARIVTTRNGNDEVRFEAEIARQIDRLGIHSRYLRGRRRVIRIHEKIIVGHELLFSGLTAEESIRLQERGLGGRQKMGCGVFLTASA